MFMLYKVIEKAVKFSKTEITYNSHLTFSSLTKAEKALEKISTRGLLYKILFLNFINGGLGPGQLRYIEALI